MRTLVGAAVAAVVSAQVPTSYSLSSAQGGRFWGVGGISGGGATSRLLFGYPEQQRNEILDYLFKPNYGASLHILKVEIGGGAQSTEGTEASHMYTPDDLDYTRGYEWQLMVEAKKRNPQIQLGALAWTFPGWLDPNTPPGHKSPWNNITATATYVLNWLKGARDVYNLSIDYLGGWNERGHSMSYFALMRQMLDAEGMQGTQLVCGDYPHMFECSAEVAKTPSLASLFVALGAHQPQAYDPVGASTGLPMWSTEAHYNIPNGQDWANLMNILYITKNVTGYQSWALLSAYDEYLAFPDHGLFRAWWPTSGHYELIGRMWVTAHTTQFTAADGNWVYLANRTGAGYLSAGGTYVTLFNKATGDWSLVIEKQTTDSAQQPQAETATFQLDGTLAGKTGQLQVWRSSVDPGRADNDTSTYFLQQQPIPLAPGATSFTLSIAVGDVITVTTLTTGAKGSTASPPPPATPFPTTWVDSFDACAVGQEADSFVSQDGSFLCQPSTDGTGNIVMKQVAATWPVQWRPDEQKPHTVGGSALWRAANVSVSFRLTTATETALLAVRCWVDNTLPNAGPISSEMWMRGAWLSVSGQSWSLFPSYANATNGVDKVIGGTVNAPGVQPGTWHTLGLVIGANNQLTGSLDGTVLFTGVDGSFLPSTGYVGLGTLDYGQMVEFDKLAVYAGY